MLFTIGRGSVKALGNYMPVSGGWIISLLSKFLNSTNSGKEHYELSDLIRGDVIALFVEREPAGQIVFHGWPFMLEYRIDDGIANRAIAQYLMTA